VHHWNTNLMITPTADGAAGQVYLVLVDFGTKPPTIATSRSFEADARARAGASARPDAEARNARRDRVPVVIGAVNFAMRPPHRRLERPASPNKPVFRPRCTHSFLSRRQRPSSGLDRKEKVPWH